MLEIPTAWRDMATALMTEEAKAASEREKKAKRRRRGSHSR